MGPGWDAGGQQGGDEHLEYCAIRSSELSFQGELILTKPAGSPGLCISEKEITHEGKFTGLAASGY